MRKRALGRSGLDVPPLCFGCNVLGWTVDEAAGFRLLDALREAGLTFLDTADIYSAWAPGNSGGESETIIGRWLRRSGGRDEVTLATKVGGKMGSSPGGLSAAHIQEAADASLRRLGTDRIDLYISHFDDPDTPFEETLGAYARLIEAGKVRAIGASNHGAARLREALAVSARTGLPRYESLQPEYNLYDRAAYEAELEPLCRAEGLGVTPYYALASGFLTGKYRSAADLDKSPRGAKAGRYLDARGHRILAALDRAAAEHAATPAAVALAWLMARPGLTAPIASATTPAQVADLAAAVRLTLSPSTIQDLDEASRPDQAG